MTEDKFELGDVGDIIPKLYNLADLYLVADNENKFIEKCHLCEESVKEYKIIPDFVAHDAIDNNDTVAVFVSESGNLPEVIGRVSLYAATICDPLDTKWIVIIVPNDKDKDIMDMIISFLDDVDDACEIRVLTYTEYNQLLD